MSYYEANVKLIAGLEVALANLQAQRSNAMDGQIWGEDGRRAVRYAFDLTEASLQTRLDLAIACKEKV